MVLPHMDGQIYLINIIIIKSVEGQYKKFSSGGKLQCICFLFYVECKRLDNWEVTNTNMSQIHAYQKLIFHIQRVFSAFYIIIRVPAYN